MNASFVEFLARARLETELSDGLQAFVRLYYESYTDATALDPDTLRRLEALLNVLDGPPDLEDLVTEVEDNINSEGGIRSATDGELHLVCTYPDDAGWLTPHPHP